MLIEKLKIILLTSILLLVNFFLPIFNIQAQEYDPDFDKKDLDEAI